MRIISACQRGETALRMTMALFALLIVGCCCMHPASAFADEAQGLQLDSASQVLPSARSDFASYATEAALSDASPAGVEDSLVLPEIEAFETQDASSAETTGNAAQDPVRDSVQQTRDEAPYDPATEGQDCAPDTAAENLEASSVRQPEVSSSSSMTHAQLVLLVRFAGDTTGDGNTGYNAPYTYSERYSTQWELLLDYLSREKQQYWSPSLRAYIEEVSGGQHVVVSESPQTNSDGTVHYLTLPHERSYYTSQDLLMSDAAEAFNALYSNYQALHLDESGYLDNILLIPEVGNDAPASSSDPLWSRALYYQYGAYGGQQAIGNGKIGHYMLVSSANTLSTETIIHEYIHTLGSEGIRDLYHYDQRDSYGEQTVSSNPVGMWDIMAQTVSDWPLGVTLENIGWSSLVSGSGAGEYTLTTAYNENTPHALKIKLSQNSNEYFVIEYRKQGTSYEELDRRIGGSGIIVYRVNESYKSDGNKGAKDYIYVFRPGETAANAGDGILYNASLSLAGRSEFGSLNLDALFSDGTIYYSDGSNSGILIRVLSEAADSVTFALEIAQNDGKSWHNLLNQDGTNPLANTTANSTTATSDGTNVYMLLEDFSSVRVKKHDDTAWSDYGTSLTGIYSGQISFANGVLYLAGLSASDSSFVLYGYINQAWTKIGTTVVPSNVYRFNLNVSQDALYVSCAAGDFSSFANDKHACVFRLNGSSLVRVGGQTPQTKMVSGSLSFLQGQTVFLALGSSNGAGSKTTMYRLVNNAWYEHYSDAGYCANELSVATIGGISYILANDGTVGTQRLYVLDADGSVSMQSLDGLGQCSLGALISAVDDTLYIAAATQDSLYVYSDCASAGQSWSKLGRMVQSSPGDVSCAFAIGDKLVAASSSSQIPICKYYLLQDSPEDTKKRIELADVLFLQSGFVYDGTAKTPTIVVSYNGLQLTKGTDYSLSYSNNLNAGTNTASVVIRGLGDYAGVLSRAFSIARASLGSASVSLGQGSFTYDGGSKSPAVTVVWNGKVLRNGTDYGVTYANNVNPGTATATVTGIGNYQGALSKNYSISVPSINISYRTHVQNIGWQNYVSNGDMSGTSGKSYRLEGINILVSETGLSGSIQYRTHVQYIGWQDWRSDGAMSGTSGQSLRLEAIQIQLTGELAQYYDIYYRVHAQNIGWMGWARGGEQAGTAGRSYRLEAIQAVIVPKGTGAPASTYKGITSNTSKAFDQPMVSYTTHVQNVGWQGRVEDGQMSGTSGKSLRLEGIKISLEGLSGSISYRTHVQNIGWQGWKSDGQMSGTSGKSLRLEAIQINLSGQAAQEYDVFYRVHAQNVGWMGWAKNGDQAGTAGYSYRLEGIQIVLVKKGSAAPGASYMGIKGSGAAFMSG